MPFEPRLILNDDDGQPGPDDRARFDAEEFKSPDLEVLAGQLNDDANFLAQRYPSSYAREQLELALARQQRWSLGRISRRGWTVAAAILLMVGAGALWQVVPGTHYWMTRSSHKVSPPPSPSDEFSSSDLEMAAIDPKPDAVTLSPSSAPVAVSAEVDPRSLLRDLSVSEQEAVLDLLEAEPIEVARISL